MEISEIDRGPEVVHCSAEGTAGEFKCRRQARTARRTDRRTIRAIPSETWNQRMRVEIRKTTAALRGNERLVLLRFNGAEVILRGLVDRARLRMVDPEIQAEAIPDLERIA